MRMLAVRATAAALLILGICGIQPSNGNGLEDEAESGDVGYLDLARQVANTSIIWVDDAYRAANLEVTMKSAAEKVGAKIDVIMGIDAEHEKTTPLATYENLGGFAFYVRESQIQLAIEELAKSDSPSDQELAKALSISADMIVSISDTMDCSDEDAAAIDLNSLPANTKPVGVLRVKGGGTGLAYTNKVWIIDSGIDNASNFITVDSAPNRNAANCTKRVPNTNPPQWMCDLGPSPVFNRTFIDRIGHGTMLAGIIAAKPLNNADPGLLGVAPGATVVPVKIFKNNPDVSLAGPPLVALDHVFAKAANGDIVNMSWGANWLESLRKKKNHLETAKVLTAKLQNMANLKNLRLVIAAGNADPAVRPNWVQFVMPAGAGSHPSPRVGCKVCTVSAVASSLSGSVWTDAFWNDTNIADSDDYGSNYGRNPPDFAEPGVKVLSIWPKSNTGLPNRVNTCSGTSFAAAHLSGIFLRGQPNAEFNVTGDPDSPLDKNNADPVGVASR